MGIKSVTLSFDDGVKQDIPFIELLNKYGIKCTFNLNTGLASEASRWTYNGVDVIHINMEEMRGLYDGHELAVHTLTHPWLEKLDERTIYNEIIRDKHNIEDFFGQEVVGMAYPFGTYDDRVVKIAEKCGIRYARTIEENFGFAPQTDLMRFKTTCHYNHPRIFEIIDEFLSQKSEEKQVLYLWGHSYELDGDHTWERFEEVCKKLSSAKGILFETNKDALLKD